MGKTHGRLVLFVLLGVVATFVVTGAAARPERAEAREPELQHALDNLVAAGVPGAVLLVREGDRTISLRSGYGNLKPRTPVRATDRFRVGSITKAFVATVVLQLVGEKKLRLTDTIERWLPGVVPNGKRITVRHLLNHTSGLFDYAGDRKWLEAAYRDPLRQWAPREIVAVATAHKPHFAPGAGWSYSNTNYFVVGLIVEAATGHKLESELRRRIFVPLRLQATSLDTVPRIAGPRFFRALLGGRLLRPDLLRMMETTVVDTREFSYGLGLEKVPTRCGVAWGHSGGSPGYSVDSYNSKSGTRQVVVFVNATERLALGLPNFRSFDLPPRAGAVLDRLIEAAYCD